MNQDIEQLKANVQDLMSWKTMHDRQQVSFPIDTNSQLILRKYLPVITDTVNSVGASGLEFPLVTILSQDNKKYYFQPTFPFYQFTANITADTLFVSDHIFNNNDILSVYTTDTLPSPLLNGINYYVVNSSGNSFQLSLSSGGSAIDLTTIGTGNQYITFAPADSISTGVSYNAGSTTHSLSSTTTQTIAHGLASTPTLIRLKMWYSSGSTASSSATVSETWAVYFNSTQYSGYIAHTSASNSAGNESASGTVFRIVAGIGSSLFCTGTITVDSTNINIAWTQNGSPSGTGNIIWEAYVI